MSLRTFCTTAVASLLTIGPAYADVAPPSPVDIVKDAAGSSSPAAKVVLFAVAVLIAGGIFLLVRRRASKPT